MPTLDLYTLLVNMLVISVVCSSVALMALFRSRHIYKGMLPWSLLFLFQGVGIFLILLRGLIPDFLSIVLANGLLVGGIWLGQIGIFRFMGTSPRLRRDSLVFGIFMLLNAYWTYVQPNLHLRSQNQSVAMVHFLGLSSVALLFPKNPEIRGGSRSIGFVYAFLAVVFCIRFVIIAIDPYMAPTYLNTRGWEPLFFLIFECGYVMLATSMVVMVNQRLRMDLRLQKETELARQKEEYTIRQGLMEEKTQALSKLKILSGMLPICASCKKIRDDKGYWSQIESYIRAHSQAEFSHGICPDCAQKLYPDVFSERPL